MEMAGPFPEGRKRQGSKRFPHGFGVREQVVDGLAFYVLQNGSKCTSLMACLWQNLWRNINSMFQNKGYGGEILDAVIEWCSSTPLGKSEKIYTSCYKNNTQAIDLYHSRKFVETGEIVDGEIVLSRTIEERHDE